MPHTELPTPRQATTWEEKQAAKLDTLYDEITTIWKSCRKHSNWDASISDCIGAFHDLQHKAYYLKRALIELRNWKKNH